MLKDRLIVPDYVNEGDRVIAPFDDKGTGVWCRVVVAAGKHARVATKLWREPRWFELHDLRIERKTS